MEGARRSQRTPSDARLDRPWIIRKANGHMYACPDMVTLRRWIGEGRLLRDDFVSKRGDRWYRLGDSPELARYFDGIEASRGAREPLLRSDSYPVVPRAKSRAHTETRMRREGEEDADRMIRRFRLGRSAKTALFTMFGMGAAMFALGLSYAMIGPAPNPLRTLAENVGILPGRRLAAEAANEQVIEARRAFARGDLIDLEKAHSLYSRALDLKPDPLVSADHALALASRVDVLSKLPTNEKRTNDAESARRDAIEALRVAQSEAPTSLPTLRAGLAVATALGQSEKIKPYTDVLLTSLQKEKREEPWSLAVLAGAAEEPGEARGLYRKALVLDDGFDRARVGLARAELALGAYDDAEKELTKVLQRLPSHEEAQRLLADVKARRVDSQLSSAR